MTHQLRVRAVAREEVSSTFLAEAAALLGRAFADWPPVATPVAPADHLQWKLDGPLPGFPAALVAEQSGALVAFRSVLARRLLIQGQSRMFLHFVDAAVDPEHQGQGINRAVQDVMQRDFHSLYDISIDDSENETLVRGRTRLGVIRDFGNVVRPYLLPLHSRRFFEGRSLPLRAPSWLAALASEVISASTRTLARGTATGPRDYSIRTVESFDDRFDAFCASVSTGFELIAERTGEFLNWRYADRRAGSFTIRIAERGEQLLGYAVTKAVGRSANIADMLVDPAESSVPVTLVEDAVSLSRDAGVAGVVCWLPESHPYRGALRRLGFFALNRRTPLVYRGVTMTDDELAFLRRPETAIHLMRGDTDLV